VRLRDFRNAANRGDIDAIEELIARGVAVDMVLLGLGRIVALYYRSSTLYHIH
jgi:hypothetical protein